MLAGLVAVQVGKRPVDLLGSQGSPLEDLLLDAAILSTVRALEGAEAESLEGEIRRKRLRWSMMQYVR